MEFTGMHGRMVYGYLRGDGSKWRMQALAIRERGRLAKESRTESKEGPASARTS